MKRLILSTAILLGGLTAVTAQTEKKSLATATEKTQTVVKQAPTLSNAVQDYKEVNVSEVPQAVKEVVAKNFSDATLSKAYVNAKGDYKLQLTTADLKEAIVYTDAKGELVKKELKKQ